MSDMEAEYKIFKEIEKDLIAIARKFRTEDPRGFATSWFLRMHEILEKWENGEREKKYYVYEDKRKIEYVLPEDITEATPEQIALFHESRKHYLKKAFRRDALKEVKINEKEVHLEHGPSADSARIDSSPHSLSVETLPNAHPPEAYDLFPELTLSDLIAVVKRDVERQKLLISSGREKSNFIFLQCMLKFYEELMVDEGNACIVQNIDSNDVNDFFDKIVRKNQATEIAKHLKEFFIAEPHYGVKLRLKGMLSSKKNNAIHQRISRYLNDMYGGMPTRLRKNLESRRNHYDKNAANSM